MSYILGELGLFVAVMCAIFIALWNASEVKRVAQSQDEVVRLLDRLITKKKEDEGE